MSVKESYNQLLRYASTNERGFTPFQFSSRRIQMNTTQLGGLLPNNPISSILTESMSWYEMWINPQKVTITRSYVQNRVRTARSVVTYHYGPDVHIMEVSGVCGWIAISPAYEEDIKFREYRQKGRNVNSPRIFLERLRDLANEPMYFVDLEGVEHYNAKYIKIFTKQYPTGLICEGYFTSFNIPESGEDAQTIEYNFQFVIEAKKSITALQKLSGMFKAKSVEKLKELNSKRKKYF